MKGLGDGFFSCRFYDEEENETDGVQGNGVVSRDPRKGFMNQPNAAREDFNRGINLDG